MASIKQASKRDNNISTSIISDQSKDPGIDAITIQTKKKRQKKSSKVDISENNSSAQRLNNDEFTDNEIYGTIDQPYGINSCQWQVTLVDVYGKA